MNIILYLLQIIQNVIFCYKKTPNLTGYSNPVKSDGYPSRIYVVLYEKRAQLTHAMLCDVLRLSSISAWLSSPLLIFL